MNIPDNYREMIIEELESIESLCENASTLEDKLYFFSGSFGILNRIMNFYTDPTLIFMHQVLQNTHQAFFQRKSTKIIPGVNYNTIPESFIDSLFLYLSELHVAFEENDQSKVWKVLEKFSVLTYATTGNGFYLYLRGKLKIESQE